MFLVILGYYEVLNTHYKDGYTRGNRLIRRAEVVVIKN